MRVEIVKNLMNQTDASMPVYHYTEFKLAGAGGISSANLVTEGEGIATLTREDGSALRAVSISGETSEQTHNRLVAALLSAWTSGKCSTKAGFTRI